MRAETIPRRFEGEDQGVDGSDPIPEEEGQGRSEPYPQGGSPGKEPRVLLDKGAEDLVPELIVEKDQREDGKAKASHGADSQNTPCSSLGFYGAGEKHDNENKRQKMPDQR
jgi:hypothetical protein